MIAKTFFIAKTFRAYGTNFLRQEKSLRDHGGEVGRPMLMLRHVNAPEHQEHRQPL
jgi:hypothetical protein